MREQPAERQACDYLAFQTSGTQLDLSLRFDRWRDFGFLQYNHELSYGGNPEFLLQRFTDCPKRPPYINSMRHRVRFVAAGPSGLCGIAEKRTGNPARLSLGDNNAVA